MLRFYKLNAKVQAGVAAYCLAEDFIFIYGAPVGENSYGVFGDNLHAWIHVDGWVIDFTAPLIPLKVRKESGYILNIPQTAFQRKTSEMALSGDALKKRGDFILAFDPVLTDRLVDKFLEAPFHTDLVQGCLDWYKKPPFKMKKVTCYDTKLGASTMELKDCRVVGNFQSSNKERKK